MTDQNQDDAIVKITEAAGTQIRLAAQQGDMKGLALRIAATRKPDGSIDYQMGFDESSVDDICIRAGDLHIVVSRDHEALLKGTTLDFVELEPGNFHFIFMNPNDPNYVPPSAGA